MNMWIILNIFIVILISIEKIHGYDVVHSIQGPISASTWLEKLTTDYNMGKTQLFKYKVTGSDEGIESLASGASVLGVATFPYSYQHKQLLADIGQLPVAGMAIVLIYKLPGFALEINGIQVQQIMNGSYTTWNDIKPEYPKKNITIVLPKSDRGLEYSLYQYAASFNEEIFDGTGYNIQWGASIVRVEDEKISETVEGMDGSIGLTTLEGAGQMSKAKMKNKNTGLFMDPNVKNILPAMEYYTGLSENRSQNLINANDKDAYPIVNYLYFNLKLKSLRCDDTEQLHNFIMYYLGTELDLNAYSMLQLPINNRKTLMMELYKTWECYGGINIHELIYTTNQSLIIFLISFFTIVGLFVFCCLLVIAFSVILFCRQQYLSKKLKVAIRRDDGPDGKVTIVFTDIESFTTLFERFPDLAHEAIKIHDEVIREACREFKGYEVKTEGDSFMLAFDNVVNAMLFSNAVQERLMKSLWPPQLLVLSSLKTIFTEKDKIIFNGLRVRIGFSIGEPKRIVNETNKLRSDYIGPSVNLAARISDFGYGGQTLVDQHTYEAIQLQLEERDQDIQSIFDSYAQYQVKGIDKLLNLYTVLPKPLKERTKYFDPDSNVRGKGYHVPNVLNVDEHCGGGSHQSPAPEDEPRMQFLVAPKYSEGEFDGVTP